MVERKLTGPKRNDGKHIKPSTYIDMVVYTLQSLKDPKGSNPKSIVRYIANLHNLTANKQSVSSSVYRALKQALDDNLLLRNSYGNYNLSAEGKRRNVPGKRRRGPRGSRKTNRKKKNKKRKRRKKKKTKKRKRKKRKRKRKSKKSKKKRKRKRRKRSTYHGPSTSTGRRKRYEEETDELSKRRRRSRKKQSIDN